MSMLTHASVGRTPQAFLPFAVRCNVVEFQPDLSWASTVESAQFLLGIVQSLASSPPLQTNCTHLFADPIVLIRGALLFSWALYCQLANDWLWLPFVPPSPFLRPRRALVACGGGGSWPLLNQVRFLSITVWDWNPVFQIHVSKLAYFSFADNTINYSNDSLLSKS